MSMYAGVLLEEQNRKVIQLNQKVIQLQSVLDELISSVLCLCSEGPDVMRSGEIYQALIKDATKARQTLAGRNTMTIREKFLEDLLILLEKYNIRFNGRDHQSLFEPDQDVRIMIEFDNQTIQEIEFGQFVGVEEVKQTIRERE